MIYLVEDDASIRELVCYTLNSQGFQTVGFEKPSDFWQEMKRELPRLVLLDIMLPEEDGLSILKKLREAPATCRLPIIMLTARSTEYDMVRGLDSGADDYIAKPFRMMELLSRVRALLRRTAENRETVLEYRLGSLYVCPSRYKVKVGEADVVLTRKEFELLCLLLSQQGAVLTRDQLLDRIWGYEFDGENRTVDVHIRTLRQKLGQAGAYIRTVRGIGYQIGEEDL